VWYHAGCFGEPIADATTTSRPSMSRAPKVTRCFLPVRAPVVVRKIKLVLSDEEVTGGREPTRIGRAEAHFCQGMQNVSNSRGLSSHYLRA
jgi:hypothetical protein